MPTPPPWWTLTQVAPAATLSSAFRIGQSAIASEPSSIASVSRYGEATEPASRWSRPITTGACTAPDPDELVDRQTCSRPVAETEPADPRRQPLELDPVGCELEPALEDCVVGKEATQHLVDRRDVGRVAGQDRPPKRPDSATEERADIGRDEARVCEGLLYARLRGLTSQVVAIIENIASCPDVLEQCLDMPCDRRSSPAQVLVGVGCPQLVGLADR